MIQNSKIVEPSLTVPKPDRIYSIQLVEVILRLDLNSCFNSLHYITNTRKPIHSNNNHPTNFQTI